MAGSGGRRGLGLAGLVVVAVLAVGGPALAAQIGLPQGPRVPSRNPQMVNLLEPVKDVLSGRAWLLAEGIDPGLRRRPGWDALTRMDWRRLDGPMAGTASPVLQAAAAAFLVPYRDPAPAFSRDVLITRDFSQIPFQTEPHLAVHPDDPDHLVVGAIDYNFPATSAYVSLDGGATWEGPFQVPYLYEDRVSGGDPVLAFDRQGNLYYASISIGVEEFAVGPLYLADLVSSIAVARSDDGGFTWPHTVSTARSRIDIRDQRLDPGGRIRGTLSVGFLDKPWLTLGPHPQDPGRDVLYLTYTDFDVHYEILWLGELPVLAPREVSTTIRLVRSEDQGVTWSEPVAVSPTVRQAFGEVDSGPDLPGVLGTDRVVQGSQPAVASDGTLYVAWLDSTDDGSMKGLGEIHVARSTDGGRTFSPPVIASVFNEIPFRPRNAFFRYWAASFPHLAAGPQGEVYIVHTARPANRVRDDGDIYFLRSLDRGETWSRPLRLNDDDGDAVQFFPTIDVGPDGHVHVMWADMRDDPSQIRYHIYYTRSEDRGTGWGFEIEELGLRVRDTRVSDFASNPNRGFPNGLFIGDYFALQAAGDEVYMVWADTRLGEFGPLNQKIGFARRRPIRSPDIFVSPPAGAGGENISIQGFNFQPDMGVFIQLEDATIATARTNAEGRFTASLYVPVTGEGPQRLAVFDESGNLASTSFYTEFGFGNLQELYEDLREQLGDLQELMGALAGAGGGAGN